MAGNLFLSYEWKTLNIIYISFVAYLNSISHKSNLSHNYGISKINCILHIDAFFSLFLRDKVAVFMLRHNFLAFSFCDDFIIGAGKVQQTANKPVLIHTILHFLFSLSATVTIVCLFTPKLYIILLHPEKNIRQSMMTSKSQYGSKQQSVKIVQPPISSQQKALPNGKNQMTNPSKFHLDRLDKTCS